MLGLKCLSSGDLGEPQRIPVCNCLLYRRGDPQGGAGRWQLPPSIGVAWVGSLSLGPGHSPLFSGSPGALTVALTVCPELVFLLQKEMKQNGKNSLKALASDLDPRPRSASRYMAFGTSSPLSGLSFLIGPERGSHSLIGWRGRKLQGYRKMAWCHPLSWLEPL